MKRGLFLVLCAAIGVSGLRADDTPLFGFGTKAAADQRALEAKFDASLRAENLDAWMKQLAARPHHVGSPWGKANAEFIAARFREWGLDTRIEEFHVLFPTPVLRRLEMVAPARVVATLTEPPIPEDSTSGQTQEQLPPYNAYSIDGDETGELVYVNYGVPADYEDLERRGIDVRGKIVIARYGVSWRGIKPKVAAEHGAIACILYSDPRDDGFYTGDPYPQGGMRPERGAQRGSVADMPVHPGDPLTPFVGATKDAKRLDLKEAKTLTKIPVLPVSHADALPLLRALGGPVAPERWRGALPLTYHIGPGPARVHLQLKFDWKQAPAYNVIGVLKGSEEPDAWIVRGNHHDAWVNGASDPVSGMIAVMEEARVIGELARGGWRPRRTLVFAAWDAEEPGLLGSVEWVEAHADELRRKVVAYVNSDSNERGFLSAGGSHTLERLVNEVARDVVDPQKKISVGERLRARTMLNGPNEERRRVRASGTFRIAALGSGSDYTPFLQHLGVASLNVGYDGEGRYGQYHSIYDSIDHYTKFMDRDFQYGVALAKTGGRIVMRLANAEILPFDPTATSSSISDYVDQVAKLADDMRTDTDERSRLLDEKVYTSVDDPAERLRPPKRHAAVPHLNLAPLRNAAGRLEHSAAAYQRALTAATAAGGTASADARAKVNAILMKLEHALTRSEGLPLRPWFRHHVYAPGFYTGYGVKTLPMVREAIEQRQWESVPAAVERTAAVIEAFAAEVDRATAALGR
jgi:N-acetylated-alpha-linked acidic dipeptidase